MGIIEPEDDPPDFAELTDYETGWVLLSLIIRSHDPAGVSLGRSYRNVLLKCVLDLLPAPEIRVDEFEQYETVFLASVHERICHWEKELRPRQRLLPFACAIEYLDDEILAAILLVHLRNWYEDDERVNHYGFLYEMNLLHPALIMLDLNNGLNLDPTIWHHDVKLVIREVRERRQRQWQ